MSVRLPEACSCLRRLLRGLPSAVFEIVTSTNLQRSGCVRCGIGDHSTYDCPLLDKEVAESKAGALYRRWVALIAEELLIFSRCATTGAYIDTARTRVANRSDLPPRPPRRIKRPVSTDTNGIIAGPKQPAAVLEPLLPTPAIAEFPLRQVVNPKPQPIHPPAPYGRQGQPPAIVGVANRNNAKVPIAPPKAKAKSPPRNTGRQGGSSDHLPKHPPVQQVDGSLPVVSQDLNDLPSQNQWEDDNTHMDDVALLCSIAKLSRDVEMLQASLVGNRRGREFTPGSAERERPDKFIRIEETPARPLVFSPTAAAASSSSTSSSNEIASQPPRDPNEEYDNWDVERYVQARHFSARQRFWQQASVAAKEKMVRELYNQPAGTPATIQARENGWIPV